MHRLARTGLALAGLALAVPTGVWAGAPDSSNPSASTQPHRHRRGLFHARHLCPDCQRAAVLARDGVNIPPPPPVPAMVVEDGNCEQCQDGTMVSEGSVTVVDGNGSPGYAVVGEAAPGSEPAPIGVVQGNLAARGAAPGLKNRDASLLPASMAPDMVQGPRHNRPHVLSHILGISAIGRHSSEVRERRRREKHASIPYGPQAQQPLSELPSSMVYGRRAP